MNRCKRCNVDIYDDTMVCPLCGWVIEKENDLNSLDDSILQKNESDASQKNNAENETPYKSKSLLYPHIESKDKKIKRIIEITVFSSVLAEVICILINYILYNGLVWSAITGVGLLYACFTVWYSCQRRVSHRSKIVVQTILAMLVAIAIDYIIGYKGWSVNLIIPGIIVLFNIAILVLVIVNSDWQNYIFIQIVMTVFSLLLLICIPTKVITFVYPIIIAVLVSVFMLFGIIVFGGRTAKNELKRRFRA